VTITAERSEVQRLAEQLASLPDPQAALEEVLAELTPMELARIHHDWSLWARPKQLIPQGNWRSFGFCAGIAFGKTRAISEFITAEIMEGRAGRIGVCAQNEKKTFEVQIEGKSGLLAVSPPWFKAKWVRGRIEWPNGAMGWPYTPERPGAMRGPEHDLIWMTELIAWPTVTRQEALDTFERRCRLGYGKVLWDTSPRRKHPLLRKLFARNLVNPKRHIIVGGETRENIDNLTAEFVEEQYAEIGGTRQGREELQGLYSDGDDEDDLFRESWFNERPMPDALRRRIISVDPAITSDKRYSDETGILDMGLGFDRQVYAIENMTGVYRAEDWARMVIDEYVRRGCCLIWLETNRGGDSHVAHLRVACEHRKAGKLHLVQLGESERPEPAPGTVYVRPINTRGRKAVRAEGAAVLMERGRVSFVAGGRGLEKLRDRLLAFDGTERTPDNEVDAFVHGCHELGDLGGGMVDGAESIAAATQLMGQLREQLQPHSSHHSSLALQALLRRSSQRRI
jgi:phage terminase large subunit-like protein